MCCTIWHAWIHSKSHWHLYEAGQGVWIFFNLGCTQICTCTMLTHGQSKLNPTLHKMGSKYRLCIVKIMQMKGLLYNQCYWKCHYVKQDETKIKSKHCYNQNAPSFHTRHTELYLKIAKMEATVFLNYWLPGNAKECLSCFYLHCEGIHFCSLSTQRQIPVIGRMAIMKTKANLVQSFSQNRELGSTAGIRIYGHLKWIHPWQVQVHSSCTI